MESLWQQHCYPLRKNWKGTKFINSTPSSVTPGIPFTRARVGKLSRRDPYQASAEAKSERGLRVTRNLKAEAWTNFFSYQLNCHSLMLRRRKHPSVASVLILASYDSVARAESVLHDPIRSFGNACSPLEVTTLQLQTLRLHNGRRM
jgi:hypothetical protein